MLINPNPGHFIKGLLQYLTHQIIWNILFRTTSVYISYLLNCCGQLSYLLWKYGCCKFLLKKPPEETFSEIWRLLSFVKQIRFYFQRFFLHVTTYVTPKQVAETAELFLSRKLSFDSTYISHLFLPSIFVLPELC